MIPGLYIYQDFVDDISENNILTYIDEQEWTTSLKRRVQHYGFSYENISSKVGFAKSKAKVAPKIDEELADLRDAVYEFLARELEINIELNQCIVNEYLRDQGIGGHVDHLSFGPIVVSVSLGADCEFVFEHVKTGEKRSFWVPRRSLLLLTKESRYDWKHSVPNRIGMNCDGVKIARGVQWRRVSATFRTLE